MTLKPAAAAAAAAIAALRDVRPDLPVPTAVSLRDI
jgi:hypothetical protein